jgi:simple sugar transport system ATP-binding protein
VATPVLELLNIQKRYFGNPVLKGVDLSLAPGEIHALIGENGAGKSTLMNILFGMPVIHDTGGFEGRILLDGRDIRPLHPAEAMAHGIGMVHQEFMLLPGFTIAENVKLGRERTKPSRLTRLLPRALRMRARALETLDHAAMRRDTRAAMDRIGLSLDEGTLVEGLPVGHLQLVEIAREIDKTNARVIVFDEPTAVLTETEAADLLTIMKTLAGLGIAILFITHRLDEVMAVADRITVLRDGTRVTSVPRNQASVEGLAALMIGRPRDGTASPPPRRPASDAVLAIEHLAVDMPGEPVHDVSLTVERGEILGIAGLAGQGKIGIANGVMGLVPARGRVTLEGDVLPFGDPMAALRRGMAFVSEDRRQVGLVLDSSVEWNISAAAVQTQSRFLRGRGLLALYDHKAAKAHAESMIAELDIRCQGPDEPVRRLSGGNQQKVCLARALSLKPKVLFVSEPTRGIDVGAKDRVLNLLVDLNDQQGVTIVVTSSELAELRRIAHRIAVIDGGRLSGILAPDASDVEYGLLFAGGRH